MPRLSSTPGRAIQTHQPDARTQVYFGCSDGAAWQLWLRSPPSPLADLVAGLWAGESAGGPARHRVLATSEFSLLFNLGPPQHVGPVTDPERAELHRGACAVGLQDHPLNYTTLDRHPRVVAVRLLPLGAWRFFSGLPLIELCNRVVDLESVLGAVAGVEPLRQRLLEAADLGQVLDLVECWLLQRLGAGPEPSPLTRIALCRLTREPASLRVEALARDLRISSRHLHGIFRRQVGFSPKALARIVRFERALDWLAAAANPDLAGLAYDSGYYDQPHLHRDFRELSGFTPTECPERMFQLPGWREFGG